MADILIFPDKQKRKPEEEITNISDEVSRRLLEDEDMILSYTAFIVHRIEYEDRIVNLVDELHQGDEITWDLDN